MEGSTLEGTAAPIAKFRIALIGAGGQARETLSVIQLLATRATNVEFVCFYETLTTKTEFLGYPVKHISEFDPELNYHVAIGDPEVRAAVVNSLPLETKWIGIIHPSSVLGQDLHLGEGTFIGQGTIITENVKLGNHTHLNIGSSISHDVEAGDYFTTAPGARVMGGCKIGERVYMGAGSILKDKISVCDGVTIGMGAMVIKNIEESGTYIGVPAIKKP
jgi:sugar O-acyltransferase (sialic acid O-acetyltransferase NeuD family)